MDTIESLRHQRDLLIDAIGDVAHKAGIYNNEVPIGGPHALMFCEDLVNYNAALRAQVLRQSERLKELGDCEEHF